MGLSIVQQWELRSLHLIVGLHLNMAADKHTTLNINSLSYSAGASLIISTPLTCLQ